MGAVPVTLLVEALRPMLSAVPAGREYPSLERVWSRGRKARLPAPSTNHLRFALFGQPALGELPVAALTRAGDRKERSGDDRFWLRADPITLRADMARVFITGRGFADFDARERDEIVNCIRGVLEQEGLELHADHPERWCVPLDRPLDFAFTALDEATGMDLGDALPDHPDARLWRRILNELQVALHHSPVNLGRRAAGLREINSVWFWGGGFLPAAAPDQPLDRVYADDPVSRGLGILNDCDVRPLDAAADANFSTAARGVLIDWQPAATSPGSALAELEDFTARLEQEARRVGHRLIVYEGGGHGRTYGSLERRRFWRRRRRLSRSLEAARNGRPAG